MPASTLFQCDINFATRSVPVVRQLETRNGHGLISFGKEALLSCSSDRRRSRHQTWQVVGAVPGAVGRSGIITALNAVCFLGAS